jgi:MFS family permease
MTTLVSLIGIVGRAIGGVLTSSLGWASSLLYGRVPADHRKYVDIVMGSSLIWGILVLVTLLPGVGSFLLATTPFVNSIGLAVLRSVILVGLVFLPAVVGLAGCFVPSDENRPAGLAILGTILRGYPLAILLVSSALFLPAVGIARKIGNTRRGWSDAHIAIVVKPRAYERLVADVVATLAEHGIETSTREAPGILLLPGRLLALLAGKHVDGLVPDHLSELRGDKIDVTIYPSDIAISGADKERLRTRAMLMTGLVTAAAHATTHAESQKVEDRIEELARSAPPAARRDEELAALDATLAELDIPTEDWDILLRLRLQGERDLLRQ